MSPLLRYLLVPFLLLFSFSVIVTLFALAEEWGVLPTHLSQLKFLDYFGGIGSVIAMVVAINSTIISFLILLALPLFFVFRDIKATLKRYNLSGNENIAAEKEENYEEGAEKVFENDPNTPIFIYGHTHNASLKHINHRVIINTGTWIKKLTRIKTPTYLLPDVYVPSYCLNYFKISEREGKIAIDYQILPKESRSDLTLLERILTYHKAPETPDIPETTLL